MIQRTQINYHLRVQAIFSMIHIFIGTKAQFIKMAPVMQNLNSRGIAYNFIDSGQHAGITNELIKQFGLRPPDIYLRKKSGSGNIRTIPQALIWSIRSLSQALFNPKRSLRVIFKNQMGICLIHGDTLSTLLSLIYAKRCGIRVAHIESGLRSYHPFDPFPEELVRLIAMRFSDILYASSEWAFDNLCKMGYQNKTINVGFNTGMDAARFAVKQAWGENRPKQPYVVVTIHRLETIYSRTRLKMIVKLIRRITRHHHVIFVLHEPTKQQLMKFDLLSSLSQATSIEILPLLPYTEFVHLFAGADFIVTDGGSIQEECYYLNKPCMVMRSKTERIEGLGENVQLVDFDSNQIDYFLENYSSFSRKKIKDDISPSEIIVDNLWPWFLGSHEKIEQSKPSNRLQTSLKK
jgi:UDP-N-acetylglucosamine 2-epimerase